MKKIVSYIVVLTSVIFPLKLFSKENKKKVKRQTIDLEGVDIDGEVRTPSGDYVLQKSGVDFMPMYEKKKEMNEEVKKTVYFLR